MPKIDVEKLKHDSVGRWYGILERLGIDVPQDPKKHGPCPICGPGENSHRFRFDDKDGCGTWICTQCGAGDGWSLAQRALGLRFIDACHIIAEIVGGVKVDIKPQPEFDIEARKRLLNGIWTSSKKLTKDDPVASYLASRKIYTLPQNVRYNPGCYCSEKKTEIEAMVALISGNDGKPCGMQLTYLDGNKKADLETTKVTYKLKPGSLSGGAVRLVNPTQNKVGVAEGIETAMAAYHLFGIPTWATLTAWQMETFEPVDGITQYVIFGDNDKTFRGQKSVYVLANKLYLKKCIVDPQIPVVTGCDWADELMRNSKQPTPLCDNKEEK